MAVEHDGDSIENSGGLSGVGSSRVAMISLGLSVLAFVLVLFVRPAGIALGAAALFLGALSFFMPRRVTWLSWLSVVAALVGPLGIYILAVIAFATAG